MSSDDGEKPPPVTIEMLFGQQWAWVCKDTSRHYYFTDDWNVEFYALLCHRGFITSAFAHVLVPELQTQYAVLDFKDVHLPKNAAKRCRQKQYRLLVDARETEVFNGVEKRHKRNWMSRRYWALLKAAWGGVKVPLADSTFQPHTFALVDKDTDEVIAGEVGYTIGKVYTSLTGFCGGAAHPSAGLIQIAASVRYLETCGVKFISLGHVPHADGSMKYKADIGCKVLPRADFLRLFETGNSGEVSVRTAEVLSAHELIQDHHKAHAPAKQGDPAEDAARKGCPQKPAPEANHAPSVAAKDPVAGSPPGTSAANRAAH
ncbi:Leu/Phe-tRNA protein transferase [Diplonema papillatum]|nr:Leu/Phe-tRNA protein transferase [Diplonema papillatum]